MLRIKEGFKGERAIVVPAFLIDELKENPLGKELYITDIGYYPHACFHYRERSREEAGEFVLIYCMEGEGWFVTNGHKYAVTANQFFVLPKHQPHAYGSNEQTPWSIYWMHFDGAKAEFFSKGFDRPTLIAPQTDSRIKDRLGLFEEIYSSLSSGYGKNSMLYAATCLFHFLGSMKFIGEYRNTGTRQKEGKEQDVVQTAIHFMKENLQKTIRLSDIAAEVKFSESHFSSLFEAKTGSSPLKYLTYLRVQEACHYLDYTDLRINQISPLVGYADSLYFSRLFTKTMGLSPSAYREKKKG